MVNLSSVTSVPIKLFAVLQLHPQQAYDGHHNYWNIDSRREPFESAHAVPYTTDQGIIDPASHRKLLCKLAKSLYQVQRCVL